VIADDYVDKAFGTGVVKVTPAHDANDYAVGQRHQLPMMGILNLDVTVNELAPAKYRGLDRFVARKAIVADLEALGLLVEIKKHKLMVPRCARTGQIIEPMLTDQWFVAMNKVSDKDPTGKSIAQKAIDAVHSGEVKFMPENWINTYNQWMNNITDWCISVVSCGGAIRFRLGTTKTARCMWRAMKPKRKRKRRAKHCVAMKTCSTLGIHLRWCRSAHWVSVLMQQAVATDSAWLPCASRPKSLRPSPSHPPLPPH
jgi:hypothetical protein